MIFAKGLVRSACSKEPIRTGSVIQMFLAYVLKSSSKDGRYIPEQLNDDSQKKIIKF